MEKSVYVRMKENGIVLPKALSPVGLYLPVQQCGKLLFISGQGCIENGNYLTGRVGTDVSISEASRRASICMANTLAALDQYLGSLDLILKPVKLLGFVACDNNFTQQATVINAASKLLLDIFGEQGQHARSAIGSNSLPLGLTVEEDVSVGSTPTGEFCAEVPGVTEVRPGTYLFQDMMQVNTHACSSTLEDVAAVIRVQVVSTCKKGVVVIDCGCKSISTDVGQDKFPYFLQGYGTVVGHPELHFERLSEEHGMLRPDGPCSVKTGDILEIIPNHICPAINLYDHVYLKKSGEIYGTYQVAARGKNY